MIHLFKIYRLIQAAILSASLIFTSSAFAAYSSYLVDLNSGKVTDLGSLGGGSTHPTAINDAGQVVGQSNTVGGSSHAFITAPGGVGMNDLGTLGGRDSYAFGINAAGQVVGYSSERAFMTGPNGTGMTDLLIKNYIPEPGSSRAWGINDQGQVVGDYAVVGFITGPNGVGMTILGPRTEFSPPHQ
jgi:probable HAF family extracellular repeat protein